MQTPNRRHRLYTLAMIAFTALGAAMAGWTSANQQPSATDAPERVDYLTFAQGAVPVSVQGAGARLGTSFEEAIRAIDGNPLGFSLADKPGAADTDTEFVFKLPALTTFDRFAVPNVLETPSPTQTFTWSRCTGLPRGPTRALSCWDRGRSRRTSPAARSPSSPSVPRRRSVG